MPKVKTNPQKIIPHLWFDHQAIEAANFYASVFPNSKITSSNTIKNTPSGDTDMVSFELWGYSFMAISAGPLFKLNPSISFMVNFDPSRLPQPKTRLNQLWGKLIEGGKVLMPLQEYPFSQYYGWVEDKYGISWQLILTDPNGQPRPAIIPSLMFTQHLAGKAQEATDFYLSVFPHSKHGITARYPQGMKYDQEGTIMFSDFQLNHQWFAAMDSAQKHQFTFNEAISLIVTCKDQKEIDYYWDRLSAVPEAEQCGWLKDKYGVSWQIVPADMGTMLSQGTPQQIDRVTRAFLAMKKFDLAQLQAAYQG